ncbi:hypothetical protein P609_11550 [Comamonas thiooxydans]|nr:hypothetical protein P609_11550 [Comamonas thiooxydans]
MAAVLGEIRQQLIHDRERCSIEHVAPLPLLAYQIGMKKLFQMKGQCIRCDTQLLSECTGCQAFRSGHNKSAKYAQSGLMRQSGK